MSEASRRSSVSWRRVLLLLGLLGTSAVAFTGPGKWAATETLNRLLTRPDRRTPWRLPTSSDTSCRNAAYRAFRDMTFDRDVPEASRPVPTPALIAERLAALPGWSKAVMFELGCTPAAIHAVGLDDIRLCDALVGPPRSAGGAAAWGADFALRRWNLVLLDSAGRECGQVCIDGVRPGWFRTADGPGDFAESLTAPGDGKLPVARVFRRQADGSVLGG
jgi:hypothetical protein